MSLPMMIYLADVVHGLGLFLSIFSMLTFSGLFIWVGPIRDGDIGESKSAVKDWFILAVSSAIISCLIPSSKTIYTIAAVKYTEEVVKNEKVQEISGKVYQILNDKLDEMIKK